MISYHNNCFASQVIFESIPYKVMIMAYKTRVFAIERCHTSNYNIVVNNDEGCCNSSTCCTDISQSSQ